MKDDEKYLLLFDFNNSKYYRNLQVLKPLFKKLSKKYKEFIYTIFLKYKQRYNDEYSLYLIIIYCLIFLKKDVKNYIILNKKENEILKLMIDNFVFEKKLDFENSINTYLDMWKKLFYLKVLVKSTILLDKRFNIFIQHKIDDYYNSLWYLIPIINYYNIKWEIKNAIENSYFKYKFPNKYKEIEKEIRKKLWKKNLIEDLVNKINDILFIKGYCYNIYIRQKSNFSIFVKKLRKNWIKDLVWVKVLFHKIDHLFYFEKEIEKHFKCINKKNYYENSKKNWYTWIHINLIFLFFWKEIEIEMQLRTIKDERKILNNKNLNHLSYSIEQWKYPHIFIEINDSINIMKKKLEI